MSIRTLNQARVTCISFPRSRNIDTEIPGYQIVNFNSTHDLLQVKVK